MYAVVATGGKQYRVSPGDRIEVEKLAGEVGQTIALDHVMMLGGEGQPVSIGTPKLDDAWVEAQIVAQKRGKKIIIFKHKRRKGYRRKQGHRQSLTALKITGIHPTAASPDEVQTEAVAVPEPPQSESPVSAEADATPEKKPAEIPAE